MSNQKIAVHTITSLQANECRFHQIRLPSSALNINGIYITSSAVAKGSKGLGVIAEGHLGYVRITVPGKTVYEGELRYPGVLKRTDGFPKVEIPTATLAGGGTHQPVKINLSAADTLLKVIVRCPASAPIQKVTIYIYYTVSNDY
jgi:hypothetical protein